MYKTIFLKLPIQKHERANGHNSYFLALPDNKFLLAHVSCDKIAKEQLQKQIQEQAALAVRQHHASQRGKILVTKDKSVFIVRHDMLYGWIYQITSPDRQHAAMTFYEKDFEFTLEKARKHANENFGGIESEMPL